jgi:hypothetical protein
MKKFQKAFGYSPDIHAPHGEHTETRENDDDPFRELNRSYGTHAFDVRGIVDYEMRDYGMRDSGTHLAKIDFWYPAHDRGFILSGKPLRHPKSGLLADGGA